VKLESWEESSPGNIAKAKIRPTCVVRGSVLYKFTDRVDGVPVLKWVSLDSHGKKGGDLQVVCMEHVCNGTSTNKLIWKLELRSELRHAAHIPRLQETVVTLLPGILRIHGFVLEQPSSKAARLPRGPPVISNL
jgi:hypothetical protein